MMSNDTPGVKLLPAYLKPTPDAVNDFINGRKHPISLLSEYCQRKQLELVYKEANNYDRGIRFGFICFIDGKQYQLGVGRNKKDAKLDAAKKAFTTIIGESYGEPESKSPVVKKPGPAKRPNTGLMTTWRGNDGSIRPPSCKLHNYYGPYPRIMLETARFELLKLIDMREGYGFDKLKLKCGIYADGRRDTTFEGWGSASDYFSCSGEPEEYLLDFDVDMDFCARMNSSTTCSSSRKTELENSETSNSVPEATITSDNFASDTDAAALCNSDSDDKLDENCEQVGVHIEVSATGNDLDNAANDFDAEEEIQGKIFQQCENTSTSVCEVSEPGISSSDTLEHNTCNEPMINEQAPKATDISKKENDLHTSDEIGSSRNINFESTEDRSVISIDNEDSSSSVNDVIVLDDSFIEDINQSELANNANSPVEIDDSPRSYKETELNDGKIIVELTSDDAESVIIDVTHTQSIKRKHKELENYEVEEGEIVDSDEDDEEDGDFYQSKLINHDNAGKIKKQKISNVYSETTSDSFVIDRKPSDINKSQLFPYQSNSKQMNDSEARTRYEMKESIASAQNSFETAAGSSDRKELEEKFKCDFCPSVSADNDRIMNHLQVAKHYSASKVLVDKTSKPVEILEQKSLIFNEAAFKGPIPICAEPSCSEIFRDIYSCVFHYRQAHNSEAVYSLADLVGEDIIPCNNGRFDCEVCKEHFATSIDLFRHRREEKHVTVTPRQDTETLYFCCDCCRTFTNLKKVLKHRSKPKLRSHYSEVKVLHVSLTRMKKKLLPFTKAAGENAMAIEINHLKEQYEGATSKKKGRRLLAKIKDLEKKNKLI